MIADQPVSAHASQQDLNVLRARIFEWDAIDEQTVMAGLMKAATLTPQQLKTTQALAARLAQGVRKARLDAGGVDLLTQEFTLDSREGVALMCLAEAMLRVPDTQTRNKLIRDKIVDQDWRSHIGQSPSLFVNATAWGLALTGKVLKQPDDNALAAALTSVLRKGGERVVRAGVGFAMKLLSRQFVTGQTIEDALALAKGREKLGYRFSYDMLGEAALTPEDAEAYYKAYAHTIEVVGRAAAGQGAIGGPGVSVKLTGLHPRYEVAQRERVLAEMYPKLLDLARAARRWDIGFHLDQEEAARFPLTLEMLERLAHEPDLAGWEGLGISLQAYQKRALAVADWLVALGRQTGRRIYVRLVKGAYWDTEVRHCQSEGLDGYPVFTRKVHSDVSYIACAKVLLGAPDAVFPQFATHNAFSIAAVHTLAGGQPYEFQCLHGMGESVYDQIVGAQQLGRACRVYAPVGPHATLLAYLVRRLLENGANTSFVNQVVDTSVTIDEIVADPVAKAAQTGGKPHPAVVMPRRLLPWRSGARTSTLQPLSPSGAPALGRDDETPSDAVDDLLRVGASAVSAWSGTPVEHRLQSVLSVAERLEAGQAELQAVLLQETSLTLTDAALELRHAADHARLHAAHMAADGALGKSAPLGLMALIAPASSPLAWSAGQIAAALATGNAVVLKPASGTVATARALVALFHACGVPADVLQVLPGRGETVGARLLGHPLVAGLAVAGSRTVVRTITGKARRQGHPPVLLARSTAANALLVDSSALPEQVITDAVTGAFDGGGRRASALRFLCVQEEVADKIVDMLLAMLGERHAGAPLLAASDVGPLRTPEQAQAFERYVQRMLASGAKVHRAGRMPALPVTGLVQPAVITLSDIKRLEDVDNDVTGPVLHVVRWRREDLGQLLATLCRHNEPALISVHTRIHEMVGEVLAQVGGRSVCVNRGVHVMRPGMQTEGEHSADLGPSPCGPFYLRELVRGARDAVSWTSGPFARLPGREAFCLREYPVIQAGRFSTRVAADSALQTQRAELIQRVSQLAPTTMAPNVAQQHVAFAHQLARGLTTLTLPSLSGEEASLQLLPRGPVLCAGPSAEALFVQVLLAVACGNLPVLHDGSDSRRYLNALGAPQCGMLDRAGRAQTGTTPVVAAVMSEERPAQALSQAPTAGAASAARLLQADANGAYAWWQLLVERSVLVNAAASGGNTQLMIMDEGAQ